MKALMYCSENVFHIRTDSPAHIREVRFTAGDESLSFCCGESAAEAGELRNALRLPVIRKSKIFHCTFIADGLPIDIEFRSFTQAEKRWNRIDNAVFANETQSKEPPSALFAQAIFPCGSVCPGCIVIEDTMAGIRAIKETERDGMGRALAIENLPPGNEPQRMPSIIALIEDFAYFCELLDMYARFDTWYGFISCMKQNGITPPMDGSPSAKRAYLESCNASRLAAMPDKKFASAASVVAETFTTK